MKELERKETNAVSECEIHPHVAKFSIRFSFKLDCFFFVQLTLVA